MSSQFLLTQKIIKAGLAKWAARQPTRAYYDSHGGRSDAVNNGIVIGSRTPVDCSYCIEQTEVDYTPPVAEE